LPRFFKTVIVFNHLKEYSMSLTLEQIQDFKGKYPKQLWHLFLVEMWERFCFYGMRGVLTIFMVDQLLITEKQANLKYGAIQAFVYAFTFVGGIFADKILGFRKSLVFGAIMMIIGNAFIAVDPHVHFYWGIAFTIIGTGFFKPNVSSMVGDLYKKGDPRRDAGFGLFYSGINIGALMGGILCVYLGKSHSWSLAFLAAAIVMVIGLITFLLIRKELGPIGDSPLKDASPKANITKTVAVIAGALLCIPLIFMMIENTRYTDYFMYTIGPVAVIYFLVQYFKIDDRVARNKLVAAFILIVFSILFFAFFEQAGGSLALFANYNIRPLHLGPLNIDPNIINNSSNSLFVIMFSPLIGILWLALAKKGKEPNTVVKFGLGFVLLALAYYVFYACRFFSDGQGTVNPWIFVFAYFVVTLGELCLSPIGLSMITKLSPKNIAGMMMGLWFLASAYGQYVAGLLGANIVSPEDNSTLVQKLVAYTEGYRILGLYALVIGILIIIISPFIRKMMHDVK